MNSPGRLRQLLRYAAVSGVSTATSLSILGVMVGLFSVNAVLSNVVATAVGTVPSFELNRRWVWAHGGRRSLLRQVTPFCVLSVAGLILSTLAVHVVSLETIGWSRGWRTLAIELANVSAYGALWVVQFIVLDRFLFRQPSRAAPVPAARADATASGAQERPAIGVPSPKAGASSGARSGSRVAA